MDTIVTTALIGTGQQSSADIKTGTPLDSLMSQLAGEEVERRLLLMAGALALYRRAGQTAGSAPTLLEPAKLETLPACSMKVAQMLANLLQSEHNDLLPEAYSLLGKAQQRLPFELLPLALTQATRDQRTRTLLLPILGERGYWLCRLNSSWSWVNQLYLEMQQILPADFETLWQEGTVEQRTEILRRMRASDPSQALEWLKAVWKKEKVDVRAAFLDTLVIGLSMADQPFLERALDDRGERVRNTAVNFLTLLTESPQALRLRARADDLLHYADGKLMVTLPASIDSAWMHDISMVKTSEHKNMSKSYWLTQALSRVPPLHWEERFSATPAQILTAQIDNEWAIEVVNALTHAAIIHANSQWFIPLTDWYAPKVENGTKSGNEVYRYYALLSHLPPEEVENRARRQLARQDYSLQAIQRLPTPWSAAFSRDFLKSMKDHYHALSEKQSITSEWASALNLAATALPSSCLDAAATGWNFIEDDNNYASYWNTRLHAFLQKINIRKSLIEEIR